MDSEQNKLDWKFITFGSVIPFIIPFYREKVRITSASLDKQNLFWIAIFVPIVYFFLFGLFAWVGTDVNVNYQGFNKFLEISKLPIGILALSPIFGVFVSNVHRTIQTEKQILATETQITIAEAKNISDGFYSHNKYIIEEFKSLNQKIHKIEGGFSISSPNKLYKKIFKKSNIKNGMCEEVDSSYISASNDFLERLNSYLSELISKIDNNKFTSNLSLNLELIDVISDISILAMSFSKQNEMNDESIFSLKTKIKEISDDVHLKIEKINHTDDIKLKEDLIACQCNFLAKEIIGYTIFFTGSLLKVYEIIFDIINVKVSNEYVIINSTLKKDMGDTFNKLNKHFLELLNSVKAV